MNETEPIVFIVDDDARVREALALLLSTFDLRTVAFKSATEYMDWPAPDGPSCLILDVELPDMSGLDLQRRTAETLPPVIFLTGHGDIPSSVRAMKDGAVDFLTKPFHEADLMRAVHAALAKDRSSRHARAQASELRRRLATLTPREQEVLPLVTSGLLNKQAAAALGISEVTLQIHRGKVMQKMGASSLAELVTMATLLGIAMTHTRRVGR
jgi:FixJ family two-component response regulator